MLRVSDLTTVLVNLNPDCTQCLFLTLSIYGQHIETRYSSYVKINLTVMKLYKRTSAQRG